MSATSIAARGLARTWPDGSVGLHPCDLDISPGEVVVLLGPSGCGKTTMLRLLAGLDRPDPGGRVLYGEDDVTAQPIERRGVGMVFQSYALFPNMTVAQNVSYGPASPGSPAAPPARGRIATSRSAGSRRSPLAASTSSRAGSASAWRSPARSPPSRARCSSTSR